jgi:hypothetical protein
VGLRGVDRPGCAVLAPAVSNWTVALAALAAGGLAGAGRADYWGGLGGGGADPRGRHRKRGTATIANPIGLDGRLVDVLYLTGNILLVLSVVDAVASLVTRAGASPADGSASTLSGSPGRWASARRAWPSL